MLFLSTDMFIFGRRCFGRIPQKKQKVARGEGMGGRSVKVMEKENKTRGELWIKHRVGGRLDAYKHTHIQKSCDCSRYSNSTEDLSLLAGDLGFRSLLFQAPRKSPLFSCRGEGVQAEPRGKGRGRSMKSGGWVEGDGRVGKSERRLRGGRKGYGICEGTEKEEGRGGEERGEGRKRIGFRSEGYLLGV